jgi:hypothetical protein
MSPYERRRRGNALRSDLEGCCLRGNATKARKGLSALGGCWMHTRGGTQSPQTRSRCCDTESRIKPVERGAYARQRLSFGPTGKGPRGTEAKAANRTREIRPSGMTTGACGNVATGAGLRPATKVAESPPDPTARALQFYPDDPVVDQPKRADGTGLERGRVQAVVCAAWERTSRRRLGRGSESISDHVFGTGSLSALTVLTTPGNAARGGPGRGKGGALLQSRF